MSLYSKINKAILLPIADKIIGRGIRKEWDLMNRMDLVSEEELIALQNQRLQALVRHCYENVPYYTRLFDSLNLKPADIQTRDDLQKLPILTKQMVRDNFTDLISKDIHTRNYQNGSTGGSTGTPLQFKKDVGTWNMAWASSFRAWEWYGFHLGEKMMTLGGNSLVKKRKILTPKDIFDLVIMRNMKRSSADVTDEAMQAHYEAYMKYKPSAIRGYASSIVILARYIEKKQFPISPLKVILTTGEILMPEYRATIERVFQCNVYDEYGAGDGGVQRGSVRYDFDAPAPGGDGDRADAVRAGESGGGHRPAGGGGLWQYGIRCGCPGGYGPAEFGADHGEAEFHRPENPEQGNPGSGRCGGASGQSDQYVQIRKHAQEKTPARNFMRFSWL